MRVPSHWLGRIGAGIVAIICAAVLGGCAARAEYVYDEPVVYRKRARVYVAPPVPPPVVVYREHRHYHSRPAPRVHRAPRVYRSPPSYRERSHRHYDDDDRREERRERRHHH
jgi:hypothetical protein